MATPHKCPVCLGTANVPANFYLNTVSNYPASVINTSPETCRTCSGKGIVWGNSGSTLHQHNPLNY